MIARLVRWKKKITISLTIPWTWLITAINSILQQNNQIHQDSEIRSYTIMAPLTLQEQIAEITGKQAPMKANTFVLSTNTMFLYSIHQALPTIFRHKYPMPIQQSSDAISTNDTLSFPWTMMSVVGWRNTSENHHCDYRRLQACRFHFNESLTHMERRYGIPVHALLQHFPVIGMGMWKCSWVKVWLLFVLLEASQRLTNVVCSECFCFCYVGICC